MIRVMLAEDMNMVRGALIALLELEDDIEVVAELDRGDAIVRTALQHQPDVAIVDIDLPGLDGLSAAAQLRERLPQCRTLVLTGLGTSTTMRRALDTQVAGLLLKDAPPAELADAVRKIASGHRVIDPQMALTAWDIAHAPLTPREADVLRRAAEGAGAKEIAADLHLSVGTVRNYLSGVVTKLNARNQLDAVRIARDAGWLPRI
nr:response regulator transcription factor [Streptomyces sp. NBC_00857]